MSDTGERRVDFGPPPRPDVPPPAPPRPPPPSLGQRVRSAPLTFAIAAVNVAAFLWAERHGSTLEVGTLLRFGAVERVHVWAGEYWRLATCMFMHVGWMHIGWNTYGSIGWCVPVERYLGGKRFLAVYLLAGVGGGCATVLGHEAISAGASGALFGIVGAVLTIRRRQLASFREFFAERAVRATLINIAIWTVIGVTVINMDNWAHLGGFVVGAVATWVATSKRPVAAWAAFVVGFVALIVVAARPGWKPSGEDRQRLAEFAHLWLFGDGREGFTKDVARGERFAKLACDAGEANACVDLGVVLHDAKGGGSDAAAAASFQKACDANIAVGCADLGSAYVEGRGVPRDPARAVPLYARACDAGYAHACTMLGLMRLDGSGAPVDEPAAVALFTRACDAGDLDGCAALGVAMEEGRGIAKDEAGGRKRIVEACEKGSAWGCEVAKKGKP